MLRSNGHQVTTCASAATSARDPGAQPDCVIPTSYAEMRLRLILDLRGVRTRRPQIVVLSSKSYYFAGACKGLGATLHHQPIDAPLSSTIGNRVRRRAGHLLGLHGRCRSGSAHAAARWILPAQRRSGRRAALRVRLRLGSRVLSTASRAATELTGAHFYRTARTHHTFPSSRRSTRPETNRDHVPPGRPIYRTVGAPMERSVYFPVRSLIRAHLMFRDFARRELEFVRCASHDLLSHPDTASLRLTCLAGKSATSRLRTFLRCDPHPTTLLERSPISCARDVRSPTRPMRPRIAAKWAGSFLRQQWRNSRARAGEALHLFTRTRTIPDDDIDLNAEARAGWQVGRIRV